MFSRLLPKSHNFYEGVAEFGLKKIYKSTGADMIGMVPQEGGKLKPKPMKLKRREEDGSRVWKTIGTDQEWDVGPAGLSHEYIGNVPVGFFVDDPPREIHLIEARVRDAIDMGDFEGLYTDADIELHEHIQVPEGATQGDSSGEAVADGGNVQGQVIDKTWQVDTNQLPEDHIIDLSSEEAGARVSWRRVNDILHEKVPTEEMNMQEKRGELAGAAGNEDKAMRIMIYALLAIVGVVFIFFLGPSIVNGIFGDATFGGMGGVLPTVGGG